MGSIISAINDDKNDWEDFKRRAQIPFSVKWTVYSKEAYYANELFNKEGIFGEHLIQIVELMREIDKVRDAFKAQGEEYQEYLRLKEKFSARG